MTKAEIFQLSVMFNGGMLKLEQWKEGRNTEVEKFTCKIWETLMESGADEWEA